MKNDTGHKLTTVKVLSENYVKFKTMVIDKDMTLQKLTNRAIEKYLTDPEFRSLIDSFKFTESSKY